MLWLKSSFPKFSNVPFIFTLHSYSRSILKTSPTLLNPSVWYIRFYSIFHITCACFPFALFCCGYFVSSQCFIEYFDDILQGFFTGTWEIYIVSLSQLQSSNPLGKTYGYHLLVLNSLPPPPPPPPKKKKSMNRVNLFRCTLSYLMHSVISHRVPDRKNTDETQTYTIDA